MNKILGLLLLISSSLAHPDYSESWEEFKEKYGKEYENDHEEALRMNQWLINVKFIVDHNAEADNGEHSFRVGENHLADMDADEITTMMNGLVKNMTGVEDGGRMVTDRQLRELPANVDWRDKGYVTHVKDQKHCGSCWAFSAVGSMEGAHFKKTGKLVSLSEQNLVDCSKKEGNMGCLGGLMDKAFTYVIQNKGIDTESSYPYEAVTEKQCKYSTDHIGATISSFKDIPTGSEADLAQAVATEGPVSVGIDASRPTFHFYKSGVYHDKSCSSSHLDHGVLVVGYGQNDNGQSYWLVKNSWGVKWGQKGYIQMAKDMDNACGIAKAASYPIA